MKKSNEADTNIKKVEQYPPWSNEAEQCIQELKKASACAMLKTGTPKRLWDDCIKFLAYILSNKFDVNADLKGKTPKNIVSGETADISKYSEFGWFDWIMFRDTTVSYPGSKPKFGQYCGPAYDIGPAMTANILKGNGK